MDIRRIYQNSLSSLLAPGKVLALYGPRRAGKTTLLKAFVSEFKGKYFFGSGEDSAVRSIFKSGDANLIRNSFAGYDLVVIDEVQALPNAGLGLKLLVDNVPAARVVASGSSSFELAGKIGEPLTGRKRTRMLFPLSAMELAEHFGNMELRRRLEEILIYGSYPEIFTTENLDDKAELLDELRDDYLFKDILAYERVRDSDKLRRIVTLLAYQTGKEVSLNELSRNVGMSVPTVERYLDLLEKTFVIFKISGFSRNLRSEVSKTRRYYFWDNGVMNSVAGNFNLLSRRDEKSVGALWENFLVSERVKRRHYRRERVNAYFWRTYAQQEIDWVEECGNELSAFEFKWNPAAKVRIPTMWAAAYPGARFSVVHRDNFTGFIC